MFLYFISIIFAGVKQELVSSFHYQDSPFIVSNSKERDSATKYINILNKELEKIKGGDYNWMVSHEMKSDLWLGKLSRLNKKYKIHEINVVGEDERFTLIWLTDVSSNRDHYSLLDLKCDWQLGEEFLGELEESLTKLHNAYSTVEENLKTFSQTEGRKCRWTEQAAPQSRVETIGLSSLPRVSKDLGHSSNGEEGSRALVLRDSEASMVPTPNAGDRFAPVSHESTFPLDFICAVKSDNKESEDELRTINEALHNNNEWLETQKNLQSIIDNSEMCPLLRFRAFDRMRKTGEVSKVSRASWLTNCLSCMAESCLDDAKSGNIAQKFIARYVWIKILNEFEAGKPTTAALASLSIHSVPDFLKEVEKALFQPLLNFRIINGETLREAMELYKRSTFLWDYVSKTYESHFSDSRYIRQYAWSEKSHHGKVSLEEFKQNLPQNMLQVVAGNMMKLSQGMPPPKETIAYLYAFYCYYAKHYSLKAEKFPSIDKLISGELLESSQAAAQEVLDQAFLPRAALQKDAKDGIKLLEQKDAKDGIKLLEQKDEKGEVIEEID
jgi:hypothetical protein